LEEFLLRVQQILGALDLLGRVQQAAREHVRDNFERDTNLKRFADNFLEEIGRNSQACDDEDLVLQQI
jgi:hypothetical protein